MQGRSVIIVCPVAHEGVSKTDSNDEVGKQSQNRALPPNCGIAPAGRMEGEVSHGVAWES